MTTGLKSMLDRETIAKEAFNEEKELFRGESKVIQP
jgi:hypothetical protein